MPNLLIKNKTKQFVEFPYRDPYGATKYARIAPNVEGQVGGSFSVDEINRMIERRQRYGDLKSAEAVDFLYVGLVYRIVEDLPNAA